MAKAAASERRARSGRRERRTGASEVPAPAYLSRKIPYYELLSEEGLDLIERHADRILKEVGVEFHGDEEALALFKGAGADVSGEDQR